MDSPEDADGRADRVNGEIEHYGLDVRHRWLVEPGIAGLWQIGDRSDRSDRS